MEQVVIFYDHGYVQLFRFAIPRNQYQFTDARLSHVSLGEQEAPFFDF